MNEWTDVRRTVSAVRRRLWLVILLALSSAAGGYAATLRVKPVYRASTSVLVGQPIEALTLSTENIEAGASMALIYADFAQREPVLQGVVDALQLDVPWTDLKQNVSVHTALSNAQLIDVSVTAASPSLAEEIANEIANQLIGLRGDRAAGDATFQFPRSRLETLQENIEAGQNGITRLEQQIANTESESQARALQLRVNELEGLIVEWEKNYAAYTELFAQGGAPNLLEVIETADAGNTPTQPDIACNTFLAGIVGLIVGLGLAIFLDFRGRGSPSVREQDQASGIRWESPARGLASASYPADNSTTDDLIRGASPPGPGENAGGEDVINLVHRMKEATDSIKDVLVALEERSDQDGDYESTSSPPPPQGNEKESSPPPPPPGSWPDEQSRARHS